MHSPALTRGRPAVIATHRRYATPRHSSPRRTFVPRNIEYSYPSASNRTVGDGRRFAKSPARADEATVVRRRVALVRRSPVDAQLRSIRGTGRRTSCARIFAQNGYPSKPRSAAITRERRDGSGGGGDSR